MIRKTQHFALALLVLLSATWSPAQEATHSIQTIGGWYNIKHVLLISVDGMHSVDYYNCANGVSTINNGKPYCPNLAALGQTGINYRFARAARPSDSFPGLMALVTGGTPKSVGAFYDVAYDRVLAPPQQATWNGLQGGPCTPGVNNGTTTEYEEGIDKVAAQLNGGAPAGVDGGIQSLDPTRMERDPFNNCAPVYPWNFVRTNTIFGVVHQSGGYTAWSDKHPAYSSVSGPGNGSNLDDYYSPEINSTVIALPVTTPEGLKCDPIPDPNSDLSAYVNSFQNIQCYDTLKVHAILNQIDGKYHNGSKTTKVPALFGMNFQAVSVGQKLIEKNVGKGGYLDAAATPSPLLLGEIQFIDDSIGEFVSELKKQGLYDSTLIVIAAKHGQSPIDPNRFFPIPGHNGTNGTSPANLIADLLPWSENPNNQNGIGPTEDDISLLWLADSANTDEAVTILQSNAAAAGIGQIFNGPMVNVLFNPASQDPRTPDIIVSPNVGVVYTGSTKKQAEHGGWAQDDGNVVLLLANPQIKARTVTTPVDNTQVAPSILKALGLNWQQLQSVQIEGTQPLPAF